MPCRMITAQCFPTTPKVLNFYIESMLQAYGASPTMSPPQWLAWMSVRAVLDDVYFVGIRPFSLCLYVVIALSFLSFHPPDEMAYVLPSRPEDLSRVVTRYSPDCRPLGRPACTLSLSPSPSACRRSFSGGARLRPYSVAEALADCVRHRLLRQPKA